MNLLGILLAAWRNKKGYSSARSQRARGVLRATAYIAVAGLGIGLFAGHSAKADMGKASIKFGREVAPLAGQDAVEVKLNGQSFFLREGDTQVGMKQILDDFEERCTTQRGALGDLWAQIPKTGVVNGKSITLTPSLQNGVLRQEEGSREGVVMCLVKGERTSANVLDSLKNFAESQDLGDLGKLRYVYAREEKGKTRVVTAWTEDSFSFRKIGAVDGEPPGGDTRLPKPEGARRFMNAEVAGTPFGIRLYEVSQSPEEVVEFYDVWAAKGDWRGLAPEHPEGTMRAYFLEGTQILITAKRIETSGKTVLSITEIVPQAPSPSKDPVLP